MRGNGNISVSRPLAIAGNAVLAGREFFSCQAEKNRLYYYIKGGECVKRVLRRLGALGLVCACLLGGVGCRWSIGAPTSTADASEKDYGTPDISAAWDTALAQGLLKLMNDARRTAGVQPLTMDEGALKQAACARAKEITVLFDHQRPNGDGWDTAFFQYGVSYRYAGENIASGQPTAESAYNSFWNSETHRDNMLKDSYAYVAIAALRWEDTVYWVQLFRG